MSNEILNLKKKMFDDNKQQAQEHPEISQIILKEELDQSVTHGHFMSVRMLSVKV